MPLGAGTGLDHQGTTQQFTPEDIQMAWEEVINPENGLSFFHNTITGENSGPGAPKDFSRTISYKRAPQPSPPANRIDNTLTSIKEENWEDTNRRHHSRHHSFDENETKHPRSGPRLGELPTNKETNTKGSTEHLDADAGGRNGTVDAKDSKEDIGGIDFFTAFANGNEFVSFLRHS